jgi:predicted MPP superfamily phosphohydrolase
LRRIGIPLLIALGLLVGIHLHLALALVIAPAWGEPASSVGLALIALGAVSIVAGPIAARRSARRVRWLQWVSGLWMGAMFLLLVALAFWDLGAWIVGAAAYAADAVPLDEGARLRAAGALLLAGSASLLGLLQALRGPRLARVELRLPRWPAALDGYRIAQLSDLHFGPLLDRRFAERVAAEVNALDADLCVVTGDLVDGPVSRVAAEVAPLAALRARDGVFFVTGNHDHYSGADAWVAEVERLGWTALRNRRVELGPPAARFALAGVDDRPAELSRALHGLSPDLPVVLLAHDPRDFRGAARAGVDLQLSGHTHGGQIWPFALIVRLFVRFVRGHYRDGASQLYVSSGTAFWGPPMRVGTRAEITEIILRAEAPAGAAA